MKNMKKMAITLAIGGILLFPSFSHAQTQDREILMEQIRVLQIQLAELLVKYIAVLQEQQVKQITSTTQVTQVGNDVQTVNLVSTPHQNVGTVVEENPSSDVVGSQQAKSMGTINIEEQRVYTPVIDGKMVKEHVFRVSYIEAGKAVLNKEITATRVNGTNPNGKITDKKATLKIPSGINNFFTIIPTEYPASITFTVGESTKTVEITN